MAPTTNQKRSAEDARAQMMPARFGSLIHDDNTPLGPESLSYLLTLRAEALEWARSIEIQIAEINRQEAERKDYMQNPVTTSALAFAIVAAKGGR